MIINSNKKKVAIKIIENYLFSAVNVLIYYCLQKLATKKK